MWDIGAFVGEDWGDVLDEGSKPFLVIYVVWHPDFNDVAEIAAELRNHFRRRIFDNVSGGIGINVIYRFAAAEDGSSTPLSIELDGSETTAAVVLVEPNLSEDKAWARYVCRLADRTETMGLGKRMFPVAIDPAAFTSLNLTEQALPWEAGNTCAEKRHGQLVGRLTYELCRMLRHYLQHLECPYEAEDALAQYLKKVQVFISHSKHDGSGIRVATAIRSRIHDRHALASFFDVHDIPAGLRFHKVLLQQLRTSAMVAVHTDSYSSREWCRREVIEAKLSNIPLVVANCMSILDDRSFPYLGNVPAVRLEEGNDEQLDFLIRRLLDEVLKDFLWRCQIKLHGFRAGTNVAFVPRPPELIALVGLPDVEDGDETVVVYPDPPIGSEEERLFARVAPHVRLRSMMEWIAETDR